MFKNTDMSNKNVKAEISRLIDEIPEESLGEVLAYLKEVKKLNLKDLRTSNNLNKILKEDRNLLKRLAQ